MLEEAVKTRQSQSLLEMESHIQNHEIITFPSSIGVTGYVFKHRSVYFSNKPAKDAKWNPDIDNLYSRVEYLLNSRYPSPDDVIRKQRLNLGASFPFLLYF